MFSISDIANNTGYSVSTVSRAFKPGSAISDKTRMEILTFAKESGFEPKKYKSRKRNLSGHRIVALLINARNYPFANNVLCGLEDALSENDIEVIIVDTQDDISVERSALDYIKNAVDGIVIVPCSEPKGYNSDFLCQINRKIPVITIIRSMYIDSIDSVSENTYTSSYRMTKLLLDHGHRNIAFISGPLRYNPNMNKLSAYTQALSESVSNVSGQYICYCDFNENRVAAQLTELLTNHSEITAIFSANIPITRGCLLALARLGLSVPRNIALVSHGDDLSFLYGSSITVASDPHYDVGKTAGNLMAEKLVNYKFDSKKASKRIVLYPELIMRGSEAYPIEPLSKIMK